MKDPILKGYIANFAHHYNLDDLSESDIFEYFTIYCVSSRLNPEIGELSELVIGGGQDSGIDGIIITINDHVVTSRESADYFCSAAHQIEVAFTFVQAKTSSSFNGGEIGSFVFGVNNYFSDEPAHKENDDLAQYRDIKDYIFSKSIKFSRNPTLSMYYVTTGEWTSDDYLRGRINREVEQLHAKKLFSSIAFVPVDAEKLRLFYQELQRKVAKEIEIQRYAIFPPMQGVRQAYLSIVPCKELIKLITDSDGNLQRSLFYENVRDYQGDNPVNQEIAQTLSNPVQQERLGVLNNGITVVAKSVSQVGNTFRLQDFQIVNGCQTSHVIFRNQSQIDDGVCLPVKIIEAQDIDLVNQITKATNRQTEVKIEAFESLRQFHKDLEEFYSHVDVSIEPRLYYERRSRQYNDTEVFRYQVVTLPFQLKSFLAVFLEEPHSTHRYYGELLQSYRPRIFQDSHSFWAYYASARIFTRIDQLIAGRILQQWIRKYRYHLALMYRLRFGKLPGLSNEPRMERFVQRIMDDLADSEGCSKTFVGLAISLAKARTDMIQMQAKWSQLSAQKKFTEYLKEQAQRTDSSTKDR